MKVFDILVSFLYSNEIIEKGHYIMFYCKENLYAEFDVATQKDTKARKKNTTIVFNSSKTI